MILCTNVSSKLLNIRLATVRLYPVFTVEILTHTQVKQIRMQMLSSQFLFKYCFVKHIRAFSEQEASWPPKPHPPPPPCCVIEILQGAYFLEVSHSVLPIYQSTNLAQITMHITDI